MVHDAVERGVSLLVEGVCLVPSNKLIHHFGLPIEKKIKAFGRIRSIQDEMIRLAESSKWLMIEQKLEPEPIEIVTSLLLEQNYGAKPVPDIDLDAKSDLDVK